MSKHVAPLVGAWIEMLEVYQKYSVVCVAPLVGAWIEILSIIFPYAVFFVAPLVGAWIEMYINGGITIDVLVSLPLWERGLK